MARIDIDQADVLTALLSRLRTQLSLDANRCYLSLTPSLPEIPRGGEFFLIVVPGESDFVPEEQAPANCTEQSRVSVVIYARVASDRTDEHEKMLLDTTRGLCKIKRLVLKALVGHDLATSGGNTFLRQLLYATHCGPPELVERPGTAAAILGRMVLTFGVDFDEDLTT